MSRSITPNHRVGRDHASSGEVFKNKRNSIQSCLRLGEYRKKRLDEDVTTKQSLLALGLGAGASSRGSAGMVVGAQKFDV